MSLIYKYMKLICLLEYKYNDKRLQKMFEDNQSSEDINFIKKKRLYSFFKSIILPIEFVYVLSDEERKRYLSKEEYERNKDYIKENESAIDIMKRCFKISQISKEDKKPDEVIKEKYGMTLFVVPYYTYYLSNQSKVRFEENVDSSTNQQKPKD